MVDVKRFCIVLIAVAMLSTASYSAAGAKEKVILDTDMVLLYDDGMAMMMLANHPDIELLGVTIVPGNTWVCEGAAYAIRQLEVLKRRDVPVALGTRYPLRAGRYENLEVERKMFSDNARDVIMYRFSETRYHKEILTLYGLGASVETMVPMKTVP